MPSKRKVAAKAKKQQSQGSGRSRYALKRARMASGWQNPRSPIQRERE